MIRSRDAPIYLPGTRFPRDLPRPATGRSVSDISDSVPVTIMDMPPACTERKKETKYLVLFTKKKKKKNLICFSARVESTQTWSEAETGTLLEFSVPPVFFWDYKTFWSRVMNCAFTLSISKQEQ